MTGSASCEPPGSRDRGTSRARAAPDIVVDAHATPGVGPVRDEGQRLLPGSISCLGWGRGGLPLAGLAAQLPPAAGRQEHP
jgi:hypothetical protein